MDVASTVKSEGIVVRGAVTDVTSGIETTILEYAPTETISLNSFVCTGTADAAFVIYIDGTPMFDAKINWTMRTFNISFVNAEIKLTTTSSIKITVVHEEIANQEFTASVVLRK